MIWDKDDVIMWKMKEYVDSKRYIKLINLFEGDMVFVNCKLLYKNMVILYDLKLYIVS